MKLLTEIGLTYLQPRIATWAYKKQKKSLLTNLSKNLKKTTIQTNTSSFQNNLANNNGGSGSNNGGGSGGINEKNDCEYYQDVNK